MASSSHRGMEQSGLIERAKQGDLRAFEQLLADQVPRIRRFARSMCANPADADDLAQEALLKAYLALHGYRFQAAFSTWLFRVVRNTCIDHARQSATRTRALNEAVRVSEDDAARAQALPDEALQRAELSALLWDALRALPVEFRTAVVLFDVEGLSHEEVAAVEGVALGTVKSRLSRGRAQLRAWLQAHGVEADGNAALATLVQSRRLAP